LLIRKKVQPEHPTTAATLYELGRLALEQGQYTQAEEFLQGALLIKKKVRPEHPDTAITLHELGRLALEQGQYTQAEEFYQRALDIYEKMFGPDHPSTIGVQEDYTNLLEKVKRKTETEDQQN
jgi:uncharacterized protein HemY